jgi:hypothetical protein
MTQVTHRVSTVTSNPGIAWHAVYQQ